jgi:hypothetical protein
MVSLDALIDSCEMLFGAMVYHWWMIVHGCSCLA